MRFPGEFARGDIVSKLPRVGRLSSLWEDERGISKLTLRPEASDVDKVKKFGDCPAVSIVLGGNRIFPAAVSRAGSFCRSFRPPSAKPRLRDPALDENLDCGLGDTELDDSLCS